MRNKYSNSDFKASFLPQNRRAQFVDILKHRYMLLILTGIFIFLGFLPLLVFYGGSVYLSNKTVFLKVIEQYNLPEIDQGFVYFWMINFIYLIMIPLFVIAFLFLCGGLRIFRLLSWDEGVFFFHDFFKGIKLNFKQAIVISLFLGIYIFVSRLISGCFTLYVHGALGLGIEIFLKIALLAFFFPISILSLISTTYFNEKVFESIRNSFYIYGSKFYYFMLVSILTLIIYVFPYFGNYYLILLGIILLMLFVFPIYGLVWNQLFLNVIDIYGTDSVPKLKGLYNPNIVKKEED